VGDRLGSKGTATVSLDKREVELGGSMDVEQAEQSAGRAAEVAAVQGDAREERLGAGASGYQSISTAVLACVALLVSESVEVTRVFDLSTSLPGANVRSDFVVAVENAHARVGGHEHQRFADPGVGDRVVVSVEAQIGSLTGPQRMNRIAVEGVSRERQESWSLGVESRGDGALVGIARDEASVGDLLDPIAELGVEVVERPERAGGKEGITQVADGALDAPLSFPRARATGLGAKW
jgi:hypothetical protein